MRVLASISIYLNDNSGIIASIVGILTLLVLCAQWNTMRKATEMSAAAASAAQRANELARHAQELAAQAHITFSGAGWPRHNQERPDTAAHMRWTLSNAGPATARLKAITATVRGEEASDPAGRHSLHGIFVTVSRMLDQSGHARNSPFIRVGSTLLGNVQRAIGPNQSLVLAELVFPGETTDERIEEIFRDVTLTVTYADPLDREHSASSNVPQS